MDKKKLYKLILEAIGLSLKKHLFNKEDNIIKVTPKYRRYKKGVDFTCYDNFDFNILKTRTDKDFILENQDIFETELDCFSEKRNLLSFDYPDISLRFAAGQDIKQPDIARMYIVIMRPEYIIIPVIISKNTIIESNFDLPDAFLNELCCFLSCRYEYLCKMMHDYSLFKDLKKIDNLMLLSSLIQKNYLTEEQFEPKETGLGRTIWIDCNRNTTHQARIKFQHHSNFKNSTNFASVIAFPPYKAIGMENADSFGRKVLPDIIEFVKMNEQLIKDVFDSKQPSKDINYFKVHYKPFSGDNPYAIIEEPVIQEDDLTIIQPVSDDVHIVMKNDWTYNVKRNGKWLFKDWFTHIVYDGYKKQFMIQNKSGETLFADLEGNFINPVQIL